MCGISGILNLNKQPVSAILVEKMSGAIQHRGPDDDGMFVSGSVGLAHRRLSIIDLSKSGHQPMSSSDGRFRFIYNGEIYNYHSLKSELEGLGNQFTTKTDSEVAFKAFLQWGVGAFEKFNGMFALAIWDEHQKKLVIARDRYGIKPLYYKMDSLSFMFCSEAKGLLAASETSMKVDKEALVEYFTFQNFLTEKTLFKGIELLQPGTFAIISESAPNLKKTKYWDYSFDEPIKVFTDDEYFEETDRLFKQAVKRQLVSDVDVGVYLSGGIDSGAITAIAASELPYIKSFTCGFDLRSASGLELNYDERAASEFMSYKFKTEHYEMVLKSGDMERVMPKLAYHIEEPRVGQSYPNYYAAQLASKFVKVVLSGAGGDELFAGYPWRYYRAVNNENFDDYIKKYYVFWQRLLPNNLIWKLFAPILKDVEHVWTEDIFRSVFNKGNMNLSAPEDYINHSLYFEAKTFLHGLLVVEDKLSMAHSLENRVPFLDNDLVDFAMKIPARLKLGNLDAVKRMNENEIGPKSAKYFSNFNDGKMIIRNVMSKYIPSEIINRNKQGFSAPDASWFKGESIEFVKNRVLNKNSKIYEFLDYKTTSELVEQHLRGSENRRLFIWSLLSFNEFLDTFGA